ncbi:hypothetical protein IQ268_30365 [Oculatella sp. LEGE 06141]|uniref:hypothetical protein n=1 Tax=Oculatella sp. LEGE 06141 TaxID=1828648 RepID=UPI001882AC62|nr:hypothetical protein [Oculatella sp. LEGE 06141]MBE9182845.1 hypothetical protein [Oculatella sp. LEGE 06141]
MDNKGNKQWVWLALDADTREIVGVYIGARDEAAARKWWESLPPVYRQCAIAYTHHYLCSTTRCCSQIFAAFRMAHFQGQPEVVA